MRLRSAAEPRGRDFRGDVDAAAAPDKRLAGVRRIASPESDREADRVDLRSLRPDALGLLEDRRDVVACARDACRDLVEDARFVPRDLDGVALEEAALRLDEPRDADRLDLDGLGFDDRREAVREDDRVAKRLADDRRGLDRRADD